MQCGALRTWWLAAKPFRNCPVDEFVKAYQYVSAVHRFEGFRRVTVLEPVDVGAGQQHHQGPVGKPVGKRADRIR